MDLFNAPPLTTKRGKILWAMIVPVWWSIAFIIAAAIPDYFGFVSVVSAATLLELTYAFPPMLALGYDIRLNVMKATVGEHGFDPVTGVVTRKLSGAKYWIKGFMSGGPFRVAINVWMVIWTLGAFVMAGLGMYAAVEGETELRPADSSLC